MITAINLREICDQNATTPFYLRHPSTMTTLTASYLDTVTTNAICLRVKHPHDEQYRGCHQDNTIKRVTRINSLTLSVERVEARDRQSR